MLVFENHHPAIIDRQTFDKVQQRLTARKKLTTPHQGGGFTFTGLLRCKCGCSMVGVNRQGNKRYGCSQARSSGQCDANTVFQDELTHVVLTKIRERFLEGDAAERLKVELRKQAAATNRKADTGQLRKRLGTIEGKLTKAKRRLLEVDRDMLSIVQDQIRELTQQHQQIQTAVEAARTTPQQQDADIDRKVNSAFAGLFRLPEAFGKADAVMQRELMQQTIQRIDVVSERDWSTKRGFFRLKSGVIHIRSDSMQNLSSVF